jgi:hypothetical protein
MFSIDQNILPPPYSLLISILFILSFQLIGYFALSTFGFIKNKKADVWIRHQSIPFGALIVGSAVYPLILFQLSSRPLLKGIAIFLLLLGILKLYQIIQWENYKNININCYYKKFRETDIAFQISLFIVIGYGLLCIGPVTHVDALDYHYGAALKILNDGGRVEEYGWFTSSLSGLGEGLNALSLSAGTEQLAGLLQFFSLLSIASIVYKFFSNRENRLNKTNFYIKNSALNLILLAAVSAPVLIFLVSSSKHQLWPIALTTFAMALTIDQSENKNSNKDSIKTYSVILILLVTAFQIKFSYCLSAFIVGLIALVTMAKKKLFWTSILILIIIIIIELGPTIYWKLVTFNSTFLNTLLNPIPGYALDIDTFIKSVQHASDTESKFIFPISILIPSSLGSYGVILGLGWIILFNLKIEKTYLSKIMLASIFIILINVTLAPKVARIYLEPYFWLLLLLTKNSNRSKFKFHSPIKLVIISQGITTLLCILYGIVTVTPGAFSENLRKQILTKVADDYKLMTWVDQVLPGDAILLSTSRSAALVPRDSVNGSIYSFLNYSDLRNSSSDIFLEKLKEKKVNYVLAIYPLDLSAPLEKCYGKAYAGPFIYDSVSRNPFNKKTLKEAWIYELKSENLPECAR